MRQTFGFTSALVALCLAVGCARSARPTGDGAAAGGALPQIAFSSGSGMAVERTRLEISPSGEGARIRVRQHPPDEPRTEPFVLTAEQKAELRRAIAEATTSPWQAQYGCPDCRDQGAYRIELGTGDEAKKTNVDPTQVPPSLRHLIDVLLSLQSSAGQAPPPAPAP